MISIARNKANQRCFIMAPGPTTRRVDLINISRSLHERIKLHFVSNDLIFISHEEDRPILLRRNGTVAHFNNSLVNFEQYTKLIAYSEIVNGVSYLELCDENGKCSAVMKFKDEQAECVAEFEQKCYHE